MKVVELQSENAGLQGGSADELTNEDISADLSTSLLTPSEVLIFPLSFAQQRFWVLDRLEPKSAVYNVPFSLRLAGVLDVAALQASLSAIVRRHEVLRASFELQDGTPVQVIDHSATVAIHVTDLSTRAPKTREAEARNLALHEARIPFDLSRGPLVRASLVKLSDSDHILLLTFHHIIFDGWSGRVFMRELLSGYAAIKAGQERALPDLPLQYTDYIVWQRDYLSGERLQKHLEFWKEELSGAPKTLDLPTDFSRPTRQSFRGAKLATTLSSSMVRSLKQLSQGEGVTLFMTLLAAFNALLARHTGQEDIVIGSPIAGRNRVELENLIGLFVNTLALRTDISGNPSFRQLLHRVREVTLGAYSHEELPFEKIVDELKPERDLSRNPIFQVMFALQNLPGDSTQVAGLNVTRFEVGARPTSKFDLSVTLVENNNEIRATFEYCSDLFRPDTIARLQQHYVNLLEGVVANPDSRVSDLPLLTMEERQELDRFNCTAADFRTDLCLHHFFEEQVQKTPNATAAISGPARISYLELNRRANQLAHYLRAQGAAPENPIGICLERTVDLLVAVLAVLKAGAPYVPLDPTYPDQRLKYILEDSSPALVLCQQSLLPKLGVHQLRTVCLDRDWGQISSHDESNPAALAGPQNLAYILFTSGSTGRPKGVALEHRNATNFVQWAQSVFSPEELAGTLFATSLCFDLSIFEIFVPWSTGGTVVIAENAISLSELPAANEITLINTVPSAMSELVRSGRVPPSVQTVNLAGEALPSSLVKQLYNLPHIRKVYNLYGPTEATTYATGTLMPRDADVTIGRPLANTRAYILDKYGKLAPRGVPGELYLAGQGLARGYYGRPELTAEKFLDCAISSEVPERVYKTGDICRQRVDGAIEYLARADQQIKVRGFRIELGEIESALQRHPAVRNAVAALRNINDQPAIVAYVTSAENGKKDFSLAELQSHLQQILPGYMLPQAIMVLDELPLTANGKLDRSALPAPDSLRPTSSKEPQDEWESALLEIWKQVLGLNTIGITDNFFQVGGNSLLAVRLVSEIQNVTGQQIPLATLFQDATVERLASILRRGQAVDRGMVAVVQENGSKPPFFGIVTPGMNSLGYIALAQHLGTDQPLYTIQGPGARVRNRPYSPAEFENMAAEYITAMKTVQGHGPYYFGGMCEGARIAFDMARILESRGEQVAVLAIFDTWVLENSQIRSLWKLDYYAARAKWFWRKSREEKFTILRQWLRNRSTQLPPRPWATAYWPGKDFMPAQINADISLFRLPGQPYFYVRDPEMGWGSRTHGKVDIHVLSVQLKRHNLIFREPRVGELAHRLGDCLDRAVAQKEDSDLVLSSPDEHQQAVIARSIRISEAAEFMTQPTPDCQARE